MSAANPKLRRAARTAAVQALYQMELSSEPHKTVIRQFVEHRFGHADEPSMIEADEIFFEEIVSGAVQYQEDIDAAISTKLNSGWPMHRLDMTLRATLRAAIFEVMRRPDVPALVIISEYVKIAGEFFTGKEPGMVNGIVENVAKEVRAAEFGLIGQTTE